MHFSKYLPFYTLSYEKSLIFSFIEYHYHLTYLGEEKEKILGRARFDEEEDIWKLGPTRPTSGPLGKRPVSAAGARRPVSEYARCVCVCNMMYVCKSVNE